MIATEIQNIKASWLSEIPSHWNVVRLKSIVKGGTKRIYLRIIGPDGKVLPGSNAGSVMVDGSEEAASVSREIDYQNQDTDVCVFYEAKGELKKGNYKIYTYESNNLIGQSDLILK